MMRLMQHLKRMLVKKSVEIDEIKHSFKEFLPARPIILEAGACDGTDTLQLARLWPKGRVYSFEPVPSMYKLASKKIAGQQNIELFPYALNDKDATVTIHVSSGRSNASSSLLDPLDHLQIHPDVLFSENLEVPAYTIDSWAKQNNVHNVDLMWLDMQGAEFRVLNASPNILGTVKLIYTEVSLIETYKGVMLYPEFRAWMEERGFFVLREDLPYDDMGNVLFIKK